MKFGSGTHML